MLREAMGESETERGEAIFWTVLGDAGIGGSIFEV